MELRNMFGEICMCEMFFLDLCQNTYDELAILYSILTTMQDNCLNLEMNSQYYENTNNFTLKLSEERNRYINLLAIAKERIKNIELLNTKLEDKFALR